MHDTQLNELAGRNVLVTGGAGLIGSRIAACLRQVGARPIQLCTLEAYPSHTYRDLFGIDPTDSDLIVGSIQNPDVVRKAVAGADYVIHAAALADVAACTREPTAAIHTNITGTQVLLGAVAACDRVRRLVFVSSASVYGNGNPENWARPCEEYRTVRKLLEAVYGNVPPQFHEHTPLRPMSVYANTKAWGETQTSLTLGAVGTSYTVVRYFSVYGEPQSSRRTATRGSWPGSPPAPFWGCPCTSMAAATRSGTWSTSKTSPPPRCGPLSPRGPTTRRSTSAPALPPASAPWPSWSPSGTRARGSWRRRCHPVTHLAATRPPTAWKRCSAGGPRSPSSTEWPATRTGWTRRPRRFPRGFGPSPRPRPPDQMTGGRPRRVIRHTVDQRIGRRGGHGVRRPSANPPNHALSPAADRVRATVITVQTHR